jgi:hypothetical protein
MSVLTWLKDNKTVVGAILAVGVGVALILCGEKAAGLVSLTSGLGFLGVHVDLPVDKPKV